MQAFMANKQRARQLAAEQAQREEKAFILHPRDVHAPTIPQPFCLRTDLREVPQSSVAALFKQLFPFQFLPEHCKSS